MLDATTTLADCFPLEPHVLFAPGTSQQVMDGYEGHGWRSPQNGSAGTPPLEEFTFSDGNRWSFTSTNGSVPSQGQPVTLTWSIVPDGTSIYGYNGEPTSPSNLRAVLDSTYGSGAWLPLFQQVFDRWSQLTGVEYVYEPNDDGAAWTQFSIPGGVAGVRGDVRIAGHALDGPFNVLAYNFFPNWGDMVLDTADLAPGQFMSNSLALRNVVAHEAGHGLGINHVIPTNNTKLMEPFASTAFDGPQFDDILAAHRGYGDRYEESGGNDTFATAVNLGSIAAGQTVSVGAHATDASIVPSEFDLVSVDDNSDLDYFRFSVTAGSQVSLAVIARGPTYQSGPQGSQGSAFNSAAQSDLSVTLLDGDGITPLASSDLPGLGVSESLNSPLAAGTYFVRIAGDHNAAQFYNLTVTVSAASPSGSATFVGTDTTTQGNWQSLYGADGYRLAQGPASLPSYAQVTVSGQGDYTWAGSTSDVRALQKPGQADRLAATWYTLNSMTVDIILSGSQTRQVALYLLDWDNSGARSQRLEVLDASTGQVLDTRTASSFVNGQYLVWTLGGHVQLRITNLAGPSIAAAVSGIFFGGTATPQPPSGSATFVTSDTTTQGNWQGLYGADGYRLAQGPASLPGYVQVNVSGQGDYTWASSTSDPRALQKPGQADRLAATWYTLNSFTIDINLSGSQTRQVALYLLDWDNAGARSQRLEVLDAGTGQVLDTRTASSFVNGQYLVWTLGGHVQIRITNLAGPSIAAAVSGIFFGGTATSQPPSGSATFVTSDTTTQGNWQGLYGADGYRLAQGPASLPGYAQVNVSGQSDHTWAGSTSDPRALQKPGQADRLAATWYTLNSFTIDIDLSGSQTRRVALYLLDWDSYGPRSQRVEVLDAGTGQVLDTRTASSFVNGQYLVWTLGGHVQLRITTLGGPSSAAALSGIFFGGA
jgi:hypothetical protein